MINFTIAEMFRFFFTHRQAGFTMFRPDPKKKAQMEQGLKHEFMWDCLVSEALLTTT